MLFLGNPVFSGFAFRVDYSFFLEHRCFTLVSFNRFLQNRKNVGSVGTGDGNVNEVFADGEVAE